VVVQGCYSIIGPSLTLIHAPPLVITTERNPNMEQYIDMAFSVEKFKAAYAGVIPNITDRNQCPQVDKGFKLQPPVGQAEKQNCWKSKEEKDFILLGEDRESHKTIKA